MYVVVHYLLFVDSDSVKCMLCNRGHEITHSYILYNFVRGLSIEKYLEEMSLSLGDDCLYSTTIFR